MDGGCEVEQPWAEELQSVFFASQGQGEVLVIDTKFNKEPGLQNFLVEKLMDPYMQW